MRAMPHRMKQQSSRRVRDVQRSQKTQPISCWRGASEGFEFNQHAKGYERAAHLTQKAHGGDLCRVFGVWVGCSKHVVPHVLVPSESVGWRLQGQTAVARVSHAAPEEQQRTSGDR